MAASIALISFIVLSTSSVAQSPVTVWSGATSTVWNNAANWSNNIPGDSDSVRFAPNPQRNILDLGGGTSSALASVAFSGSSSFTLQNGTLLLNNNGEISVTFDAPAGLAQTVTMTTKFQGFGKLTNNSQSGAVLNIGDVTFTSSTSTSLQISGPGAINITGSISDGTGGSAASLNKTGNGTVTLSGANTYAGSTTIAGGVLSVSNFTALGVSAEEASNLTLNGGTLRFTGASGGFTNRLFALGAAGGTLDASGAVAMSFGSTLGIAFNTPASPGSLTLTGSGNGALALAIGNNGASMTSLTKTGPGTWTLSGTNTFSGTVEVQQGTLWLAKTGASGNDATYTVTSAAMLAVGSGKSDTVELGALAGSGTVSASLAGGSGATSTLVVGSDDASTVFAGSLQNSSHILALTKIGTGTLTLSHANNSYSGPTTVNTGTLRVTGNITNSAVIISGSGTVDGTGTIGNSLTVSAGGKISPGSGIGALSGSTATFEGLGSYDWEITSAKGEAGKEYDLLALSAGLSVTATPENKFTLNVLSLEKVSDFDPSRNYKWTLVDTTTGITGFAPGAFTITTDKFDREKGTFGLETLDGDLVLTFTPIPEPSTMLGVLTGMVIASCARRKRSPHNTVQNRNHTHIFRHIAHTR